MTDSAWGFKGDRISYARKFELRAQFRFPAIHDEAIIEVESEREREYVEHLARRRFRIRGHFHTFSPIRTARAALEGWVASGIPIETYEALGDAALQALASLDSFSTVDKSGSA